MSPAFKMHILVSNLACSIYALYGSVLENLNMLSLNDSASNMSK